MLGTYGIRWDEIKTIQYSVSGDWIEFDSMLIEGKDKRLSIAGPRDWAGEESGEARQWFYAEVRRRGLEIRESVASGFKFTRNARLS